MVTIEVDPGFALCYRRSSLAWLEAALGSYGRVLYEAKAEEIFIPSRVVPLKFDEVIFELDIIMVMSSH